MEAIKAGGVEGVKGLLGKVDLDARGTPTDSSIIIISTFITFARATPKGYGWHAGAEMRRHR